MKKMPVITRKKYQFLGWYTASKNGKRVKAGMQLTGDITLYAHWSKIMVPRASIRKLYNSKNCVILKYKKNKKATGYQMQISTSKNYAGKATSTKTYKTNKIFVRRISGLKSGKTYYFRVRAYKKDSVGCLVKGKWSKSKKITVK